MRLVEMLIMGRWHTDEWQGAIWRGNAVVCSSLPPSCVVALHLRAQHKQNWGLEDVFLVGETEAQRRSEMSGKKSYW